MGISIGVNALTSGGLFIVTIFLLIMGIVLVTAHSKVEDMPDFEATETLQEAATRLKVAYILTFIATGITLLLTIAYSGHEVWWEPSEWVHTVLYVIVFILVIIVLGASFGALNKINMPEFESVKNGSPGYIWAALILGLISFMGLIVTGSGRIGYSSIKNMATERINLAEQHIHNLHDTLVSKVKQFSSPAQINVDPMSETLPLSRAQKLINV